MGWLCFLFVHWMKWGCRAQPSCYRRLCMSVRSFATSNAWCLNYWNMCITYLLNYIEVFFVLERLEQCFRHMYVHGSFLNPQGKSTHLHATKLDFVLFLDCPGSLGRPTVEWDTNQEKWAWFQAFGPITQLSPPPNQPLRFNPEFDPVTSVHPSP